MFTKFILLNFIIWKTVFWCIYFRVLRLDPILFYGKYSPFSLNLALENCVISGLLVGGYLFLKILNLKRYRPRNLLYRLNLAGAFISLYFRLNSQRIRENFVAHNSVNECWSVYLARSLDQSLNRL